MSQVKFIFNSQFISIQCNSNDKMKEICQKFVTELGENDINNFLFLYNGSKINLELTFSQHIINFENEDNNFMAILVYNTNDSMINQIASIDSIQRNQCPNQAKINNNENVRIGLVFRAYDKEKILL